MPILSVTSNSTSSPTNNTDAMPMTIDKIHHNCCVSAVPCGKHCVSAKTNVENEQDLVALQNAINSPWNLTKPNKRNTSLVSRSEDDHWVNISDKRLKSSRLGALYDGSQFTGVQKCNMNKYKVMVDIQHVDLKESKISGYLNIEGLTSECPDLTTFFQGEIIGPQYSFLTRKWQAQQYIDALHWGKFPSFEPFIHKFNDDDFTFDPSESDFIYMRWKEHFLVPDHCVNNIEGASFAGFYYICYQRSTNQIKGFYFYHHNPEWFQELVLEHVEERSFGSFEFR